MKTRFLASAVFGLAFAFGPAHAADDVQIARLATCRDSWMDWSKTAPARLQEFVGRFRSNFAQNGNDGSFVPRAATSIAGLRIVQVFPQSVGMGVGFSVTVDADFDKARKALEGALGKPLAKCETGDGMRSCELDVAEQRTVMLMAADNEKDRALVGCYYLYEK